MFGTQSDLARAVGVTRQAVGLWPDVLSLQMADRVIGAALRLKVCDLPEPYRLPCADTCIHTPPPRRRATDRAPDPGARQECADV